MPTLKIGLSFTKMTRRHSRITEVNKKICMISYNFFCSLFCLNCPNFRIFDTYSPMKQPTNPLYCHIFCLLEKKVKPTEILCIFLPLSCCFSLVGLPRLYRWKKSFTEQYWILYEQLQQDALRTSVAFLDVLTYFNENKQNVFEKACRKKGIASEGIPSLNSILETLEK